MMSVHEDTLQSLKEALEYVKGDKSKGRSMIIEMPDDEVDASYLIYQKIAKMSELNRQRVARYVDGLMQASGG